MGRTVTVTVSNNIRVRGALTPLRAEITKRLTVDNPEYVDLKRRKKPTWGIDQKLKLYSSEGTDLILPRGFQKELWDLMKGRRHSWHDTTTMGKKINFGAWSKDYAIREAQLPCLNAIRGRSGCLIAPAGSGKTIMGLRAIYENGAPALWITHTIDLLVQTTERAYACMPNIGRIGKIAEGVCDYGDGKLIVATVQTLQSKPEIMERLNHYIGTLVVDECLSGDTLISMSDGTVKEIRDICDGDEVVGGTVSNFFSREGMVYSVNTQYGELRCTETHKHLCIPKSLVASTRSSRQTKDLQSAFVQTVCTKDVQIGDYLLAPSSLPCTSKRNVDADKLAFLGMILTDGHVEKHRMKVSVRKDFDFYREWFRRGLEAYGESATYKESVNSRGDLTLWTSSKPVLIGMTRGFGVPVGRKAAIIDIPDFIMQAPDDAVKSFINMVFSLEGTASNDATTVRLVLDMASKRFIDKLHILLLRFGVNASRGIKRGKVSKHSDLYRLSIGGVKLVKFKEVIGTLYLTRKQDIIDRCKGLGDIRDTYCVNYEGQVYRISKVKSITPVGEETVYDFTTTSHTFIANGLLTHNCHHAPSSTFIETVSQSKAHNILGLTASPERKDGLECYTYAAIGPQLYEIGRQGLYDSGRLIKPEIKFHYTNFKYDPASVRNEINSVDAGGEELDYRDVLDKLIADEARLQLIVRNVSACDGYQLVISDSIEYCHAIADLLKDELRANGIPKAVEVVHGPLQRYGWRVARSEAHCEDMMKDGIARAYKYNKSIKRWQVQVANYTDEQYDAWNISTARRKEIMRDAADRKVDILIATGQLVQEGLDMPHLNHGHLVTPKKGDVGSAKNGASVEQAVGRLQRPDPKNPNKVAVWHDYVDDGCGVLKAQYHSRRKVYERLGLSVPRKPKTKGKDIEAFLHSMSW